jgi:tetratricopeptide (TPR) repeat protein
MKTTHSIFQMICFGSIMAWSTLSALGQLGPVPEDPAVLEREARASLLVDAGQKLLEDGKLDMAVTLLKEATALDGQNFRGWYRLGQTHAAKGMLNEAIADYRHFVTRDSKTGEYRVNGPSRPIALLELAILLSQTDQKPAALELYQDALSSLNNTDNTFQEPVPLTVLFEHGSGSTPYSPAMFEAAARVAMGIEHDWISFEALSLAQFRAAVKLQPRLAIAQFYLGLALTYSSGRKGDEIRAERTEALRKAALYGDNDIKRAVRELQTDGKISLPKVSPKTRRAQLGLGSLPEKQ